MDPAIAVDAAKRAPKGEVKHYDADHFEVYHSPLIDEIVADQIAFFKESNGPVILEVIIDLRRWRNKHPCLQFNLWVFAWLLAN